MLVITVIAPIAAGGYKVAMFALAHLAVTLDWTGSVTYYTRGAKLVINRERKIWCSLPFFDQSWDRHEIDYQCQCVKRA